MPSVAAERANRLILASASPRRLELLRIAGFEPEVCPAGVDETPAAGEEAQRYVVRLAGEKSAAIADAGAAAVVVAADTVVVVDGEILGKPLDAEHAVRMLRRLRGRAHLVHTGVVVTGADGHRLQRLVSTQVWFTALTEERIRGYVATGEPLDKAGAYAIQGRAAAFVEKIVGSWTNVVGLPLVETIEMLEEAGVAPA